MPLPTQVITLPIAGGLAEGADPRVIEPGSYARLHNYVFDKAGSLRKRSGYAPLSLITDSGYDLPQIERLDALADGELVGVGTLAHDQKLPFVHSFSEATNQWYEKAPVCPATISRSPLIRSGQEIMTTQMVVANGRQFLSYGLRDSSLATLGIFLRVTDLATGTVISDDQKVVNVTGFLEREHALFLQDANTLALVYPEGSTVKIQRLDTVTGGALGAPATVTTAPGVVQRIDAVAVDTTAGVWTVAYTNASDSKATLRVLRISGTTQTHSASITGTSIDRFSVASAAGRVGVSWADAQGGGYWIYAKAYNASNLSALYAAVNLVIRWVAVNAVTNLVDASGQIWTVWDGQNPSDQDGLWMMTVDPSGALVGPVPRVLWHTAIYSRPWLQDANVYLLCANSVFTARLQGGSLVCLSDDTSDTTPPMLMGMHSLNDAYPLFNPQAVLPAVTSLAPGGRCAIPFLIYADAVRPGIDRLVVDFRQPQRGLWNGAQAQRLLHQSGGFVGVYDGQTVVESGFMQAPRFASCVVHTTGGSISDAGGLDAVYAYVAVYAWLDAKGNLHLSAPSEPQIANVLSGTTAASVDLEIETCSLTRRGDPNDGVQRDVQIWIYRTQANTPEVFYRTSIAAIINDRVAFSTTVTDVDSDATMVGERLGTLYTTGGILEAVAPPPMISICAAKGRLWGVSSENDRSIWYTQILVAGEAPRWHPGLSLSIDDSQDGATAVCGLDDKVLIFTPTTIRWISGDGPNDTGAGGSFGGPYLLSSVVGCVDARSVVSGEFGVMFQSAGGMYLVTRSLQLAYVGGGIEDTLDTFPTIKAAVVDADRSRVIFLAAADDASIFVAYDYLHTNAQGQGVWMTWGYAGADIQAQTLWRGKHVYRSIDGVCMEAYGTHPGLDPSGQAPTAVLETPWIKVAGIDGYERLRHVVITGRQEGPHTVQIELFNDYDDATIVQTTTFDATGTSTLVGLPVERLDAHVARQKASAIKIRVTDSYTGAPVTNPRVGMLLNSLSLEVGVKQGRAKLPTPNRK